MEPLTIGAAVSGMLTSSIKTSRLLKSCTSVSCAPQSMKTVLGHLISISTILRDLRPFLDNPSNIPVEVQSYLNIQHLVVPLTSGVITYSHLEHLIDTIRMDPKVPVCLYARMEGISSLDYVNSALSEEDVIRKAENSQDPMAFPQVGSEVVGLALLDDGLSWLGLAKYDKDSVTESDQDANSLFNKDKWDEEEVGDMVEILQCCQESLKTLAGLFSGTAQVKTSAQRLSEFTTQILEHKTLKRWLKVESFEIQHTPSGETSSSNHHIRQRYKPAYDIYLYGDLGQQTSTDSPTRPSAGLNSISQQCLPILPSSITNTAWYRFPASLSSLATDSDAATSMFHITVKNITGKIIPFKIHDSTTCLELKQMIEKSEGLHLHQQYLVCEPDYRWLRENVVLTESGVSDKSMIHVLLPFWGRERM